MFIVFLSAVLCTTSLWLGYQLGSQWHRNDNAEPPILNPAPNKNDEDEDEGDITDGDLATIKAGPLEPCKLVRATSGTNYVNISEFIPGSHRSH